MSSHCICLNFRKMFLFFPKILTLKCLPFAIMAILIETSSLLSLAKMYTHTLALVVSINPIQVTAVHHSSARGPPNYLMLLPNYCLILGKNSFLSQQDIRSLCVFPSVYLIHYSTNLSLSLSVDLWLVTCCSKMLFDH